MASQFESKVALVTGGNSGIGRAAALAFAKEGARVVIAARRADEGEETVAQIKTAGGEACFAKTDVTRPEQAQAMVRTCLDVYGGLDFAFNNAGMMGTTMVKCVDLDEATWDRMIDVNVKGVWLSMKFEIPAMLARRGGVIVNMSSTAGVKGGRAGVAYHASKHAVIGLTRTAAREYSSRGIRINAVCPGLVRTEDVDRQVGAFVDNSPAGLAMASPIGRICEPDDVARSVIWMCSSAGSFMTGHSVVVDGGMLA